MAQINKRIGWKNNVYGCVVAARARLLSNVSECVSDSLYLFQEVMGFRSPLSPGSSFRFLRLLNIIVQFIKISSNGFFFEDVAA